MLKGCPFHGFAQHDLILYLYEGLCKEDRRWVNAACGGNIMRKTSEEASEVLNTLADDSRQITLKKGERATLGESIFNKELAALKEDIHHLKEKAHSPQVPKSDVCHENMHNTLCCPSRLKTVQSVVGIPHQVLDTPPQMPITTIPKPMED